MRDERAFSEMLAAHRTELYAFAYSICRKHHDAEAILQQVALIAWQKLDEFDAAGSFGKWTRAILYRVAMNYVRAQKRLPVLCEEETLEALSNGYDRVDEAMKQERLFDILDHCMSRLPEPDRQALRLRYYEGKSASHMAGLFKRSVDAVDVMIFRIRRQLEKCIRATLQADGGAA
jgi:RNA polymerase sigma-70 factor (ECF subfamily)